MAQINFAEILEAAEQLSIEDREYFRDLRKNKIPRLQLLLSGFNRVIGKLFKRKSLNSHFTNMTRHKQSF